MEESTHCALDLMKTIDNDHFAIELHERKLLDGILTRGGGGGGGGIRRSQEEDSEERELQEVRERYSIK